MQKYLPGGVFNLYDGNYMRIEESDNGPVMAVYSFGKYGVMSDSTDVSEEQARTAIHGCHGVYRIEINSVELPELEEMLEDVRRSNSEVVVKRTI